MTWIRTYSAEEASGPLRLTYDEAIRRAGRVYGILRAMSVQPSVLDASIDFYLAVMFAKTGLSRRQREMLAVVVSRSNKCHY